MTPAAFNTLGDYEGGDVYKFGDTGPTTLMGSLIVRFGDTLIATIDRVGGVDAVAGDWIVLENNQDGVVIGPAASTDNNIATFNSTTGKIIKDSGIAVSTIATAQTTANNAIPKATITAADQVVVGTANATPGVITLGASQLVGKAATGLVRNLTKAEVLAILNITDGAQPNVPTNLALGTVTATTQPITNSNGTGFTLPSAIATSAAGLMSGADKLKLDSAASINTVSTIVIRDASGNFSAGTITAALSGNATSATSATTATNIAGGLQGSIPYQTAVNATTLLAKGTANQVLTMNAGATAPI